MLKNKNNFEIKNSYIYCWAENFSDHPRIMVETDSDFIKLMNYTAKYYRKSTSVKAPIFATMTDQTKIFCTFSEFPKNERTLMYDI